MYAGVFPEVVTTAHAGVIHPEMSSAGKWNFLIVRDEEIHIKGFRFSEHQILDILKQAEVGTRVPELCREHGMSSAMFYN